MESARIVRVPVSTSKTVGAAKQQGGGIVTGAVLPESARVIPAMALSSARASAEGTMESICFP